MNTQPEQEHCQFEPTHRFETYEPECSGAPSGGGADAASVSMVFVVDGHILLYDGT